MKLKFAGQHRGKTINIKGVQFTDGETVLAGDPARVADLVKYLAYWQALPVDAADKLQHKLDTSTVDVDKLAAEAAAAKAKVAKLEAELKEKQDGKMENRPAAPSGEQPGNSSDKATKSTRKGG